MAEDGFVDISARDVFFVSLVCGLVAVVAASRAILGPKGTAAFFLVTIVAPLLLVAVDASGAFSSDPFLYILFPTLMCALRGGAFCPVETVRAAPNALSVVGVRGLVVGVCAGFFFWLRLGCSKRGSAVSRLVTSALAGGLVISCALRLVDAYGAETAQALLARLPPPTVAAISSAINTASEATTALLVALAEASRSTARALEGAAKRSH